jgi:acyl-CoA synthetase (AMP-forming)/AMP-acid ligase II
VDPLGAARPHDDVPSLRELMARRASTDPDAPALGAPERGWLSYAAVAAHTAAIATALEARGIVRGDAVAVVLPDGPEMALAFLGVSHATTCAPLNPALTARELAFYLDDLDARAVLVAVEARHAVVDAARARGITVLALGLGDDLRAGRIAIDGPDVGVRREDTPRFAPDVALVLHTSGTTARPKIVPLSHSNLAASARNIAATLALAPDDRGGCIMPLFHVHGLMAGLSASLVAGASVLCTPGFVAPDVLHWFDANRVTWTTAVPTMLHGLLDRATAHPSDLPRHPLRFLRSSSSSLPPSLLAGLEDALGAPVVEAYGMTEAAHQICSNALPPDARRPGTVGRPAGPEVAILADGALSRDAQVVGEIVLRGTNITGGYVSDDAAVHERAFIDGWFRTGDQGRFDADGYLTLTGRLKELINRGGEKIAPREVDEALLDHPAIAQALCFAVPDSRLGEQVAAAVVPAEGANVDERDLRAFVALRLAPFKVPRRVVVVDRIPTGPTGKLQRIGLAARLGLDELDGTATPGEAAFTAPRNAVEELVATWWCEVLGRDLIGVLDHFIDVGGDSVLAAKLLARAQRELAVEISVLDFFDAPTVAAQAELIAAELLATDV